MENLLEVKNLQFSFRTYGGVVKAVRDVSFEVRPGEILGIVGESGCGKSVTSQCLMRLNPEPPGFFEGGEILYKGKDVLKMNKKELRQFRGKEISYIFQDPMTSLNPTMRIGKQIEEVFVGRKGMSAAEKKAKALEILKMVGISDGERRYKQYPHELSGGMKQKLALSCALIHAPHVLFLDEPTTGVDPVSRKEFWEMLQKLKKNFKLSIVVSTPYMDEALQCDRIALIQDGQFLTIDTPENIIRAYTQTLWSLRSDKMHRLLTDLRSIDGVKTAFAFGENHHATIDTSVLTVDSLRNRLVGLGHRNIVIEVVEPTIEDCFMNLQK